MAYEKFKMMGMGRVCGGTQEREGEIDRFAACILVSLLIGERLMCGLPSGPVRRAQAVMATQQPGHAHLAGKGTRPPGPVQLAGKVPNHQDLYSWQGRYPTTRTCTASRDAC